MKRCVWDEEKNNKLKRERGISFEEVAFHIEAGHVRIVDHPNQAKYRGQKLAVVNASGYAYIVPFVETEQVYILKTIFPSRKAVKLFLEKGGKDEGKKED